MRPAAAWRHVTVEIAVLFLVAATMLLIRAGATPWADDSTGHPGTRRPGGTLRPWSLLARTPTGPRVRGGSAARPARHRAAQARYPRQGQGCISRPVRRLSDVVCRALLADGTTIRPSRQLDMGEKRGPRSRNTSAERAGGCLNRIWNSPVLDCRRRISTFRWLARR